MKLNDQIIADQNAVAAAQAALDAANAQLATDEATLAGIQPHLSLLDQIEAQLGSVETGLDTATLAAIDTIKTNITALIGQMRDLFLSI